MHGGNFPFPLHRSLFALAQHHGVPTRLLDWSYDPSVAAYFACKNIAKAAALGTVPQGSKCCSVFALKKDDALERLEALDGHVDFELVEVTAPYDANPNLQAQKGTFTLVVRRYGKPNHSRHLPTIDELLTEYIKDSQLLQRHKVPTLLRFDLPQTECRKLLRLLVDLNVSASTLFPGYDGVVEALREVGYLEL